LGGSTRGIPEEVVFPRRIDRIAVGRRTCFGLASTGEMFEVDIDFRYVSETRVISQDVGRELPSKEHPVIHFAVGWYHVAAVFKDAGLIVWNTDREAEERQRVIDAGEVPSTRTFPGHLIDRTELPSEEQNLDIISLMLGENYLIYLTHAGTVHRVDLPSDLTSPLLSAPLIHFTTTPKLSHLSGSFRHFALFNSLGTVLLGTNETTSNSPPTVPPSLQHRGVLQLISGDWHFIALLEDGSVIVWGTELSANGCLGMGYEDLDEARAMGLTVDGGEVIAREPVRVPFFEGGERFAFCVAAGGWHSAALVADFKVREYARDW
jgi:hypothetical protein